MGHFCGYPTGSRADAECVAAERFPPEMGSNLENMAYHRVAGRGTSRAYNIE
ncbi:MAG: hypothetical protein CFH41_02577 [Alphaproteobacteria bacterium MarineAlpha11_Bin1]|nr:MAG: hypothetical protein CFH41_02577 [Alphaproteobacteria bacterium MarineAlpha11_Bin1]